MSDPCDAGEKPSSERLSYLLVDPGPPNWCLLDPFFLPSILRASLHISECFQGRRVGFPVTFLASSLGNFVMYTSQGVSVGTLRDAACSGHLACGLRGREVRTLGLRSKGCDWSELCFLLAATPRFLLPPSGGCHTECDCF